MGTFHILAFLVGCFALANGEFKFASYYDNNMVLQRAPARPYIWGYNEPLTVGQTIYVTLGNRTYNSTVYIGPEGVPVWGVNIDPVTTLNNTIVARSGLVTINITNVAFGDIWVCSGQSNMQHILQNIDNPEPDIADVVNNPNVRIFAASRVFSDRPLYDLNATMQKWAIPTPTNIRQYSAVCWLFGKNLNNKLNVPIGLIHNSWGGTRIEAWSSPEALDTCFPNGAPPGSNQQGSSVLWNSMIHPLLNMTITGAIWYQGESNAGRYDDYNCSKPAMINGWRSQWNKSSGNTSDSFPFGFVQLAPYRRNGANTFPELRWAQTTNTGVAPNSAMPNTFMSVAIDLPDFDSPHGSIHPRYKRQISNRLALGAFGVHYKLNDTGRYQGPIPTSAIANFQSINITYDNGTSQLRFRNFVGFEICCSSSVDVFCPGEGTSWQEATIANEGTSSVSLDLLGVCIPGQFTVGIRYLWKESPCEEVEQCTVYSTENNLPAPPFVFNGVIQGKVHF